MCVAISCHDSYPVLPVQALLSEYPAGTALALVLALILDQLRTLILKFDIMIKQPFTRIMKVPTNKNIHAISSLVVE